MKNKKTKTKDVKTQKVKNEKCNKDEYGYDFVAELAHFTNIDEQREIAKKLEKL